MCICADIVGDVSKTKIGCFHVAYKINNGDEIIPSQLIVYSAQVDSLADSNAFILPVYNPDNNVKNIIPLDFSAMFNFFDHVEKIYDRWFPPVIETSYSTVSTNSIPNKRNLLEVHQVGDYKFSIVPSKEDFNRIDQSQLNVSPMAKTAIDAHSNYYSFIVYQFFQQGKLDITPFGYLCLPYQEHAMIIPTIHGHPHDDLNNLGLGYIPNMYVSHKPNFEEQADFDHTVYGLVKSPTENDIMTQADVVDMDKLFKQIQKDYLNRKIRMYCPRKFMPKKLQINGRRLNRNMIIKPTGHQFVKDLTIDSPTTWSGSAMM